MKIPAECHMANIYNWEKLPIGQENRMDIFRPLGIKPAPALVLQYAQCGERRHIERVFLRRMAGRYGWIAIGAENTAAALDFIAANSQDLAMDFAAYPPRAISLGDIPAESPEHRISEPWFSKNFDALADSIMPHKPAPGLTLHLAGDSTMSNKEDAVFAERGWGQALRGMMAPGVGLANFAVNGRSTKSFRMLGHWDHLLEAARPGDIAIIQFGHNDANRSRPDRYVSPAEYGQRISRFIDELVEIGAKPIIATPICRRRFENGELVPTHGDYPAAAKAVADAKNVPLIDMERLTANMLSNYGEVDSAALFLPDNTHLNARGAIEHANLAVRAINELNLGVTLFC